MSLTPSRGRLFQTLHPLVQLSGFKRRNLRVQKPSHVAGLGGRQIAGRDCGKHRRYSVRSVPGTFDLRKVERHRTILAGWNEAIDTKAKGRKIATFGKLDRLPSKDLGLASPSSNACAANVVAFRDPFGWPLGLPECPGLNRLSCLLPVLSDVLIVSLHFRDRSFSICEARFCRTACLIIR